MPHAERASREPREPREPRARDLPASRAAARPKVRSVDDFSDEALLAELGEVSGDDDGPASDGGETFESLEALERRLRRELAAMPDLTPCDEEAAIRREIEATDDEPDEATALYLSLMQDERSHRARRRAEREAIADSIARSVAADASAHVERLRAEAHAEKMEAVRLNRAGDKEGARAALRRAKAAAARADEETADANVAAADDEAEAHSSLRGSAESRGCSDRSETIARSVAADASAHVERLRAEAHAEKMEAVRLNRAGDKEGARAALRRAKAAAARADDAETTERADAEISERSTTDRNRDAADRTRDPRAFRAHLEALMAAARAEMSRAGATEDPDAEEGGVERDARGSGSPGGDARLSSDALGANRDGAHHTGAHDGLDADGTSRDVDAGALALERCAELEGEILELRRRASAAKRAGDSVTAREFLKAALAAREELRETRAFAEDEADA